MSLQPFVFAIFHVGVLCFFLLLGKTIRVWVKPLQYLLLPSAAIGGLLAMAVSPYTVQGLFGYEYPQFAVAMYDNFGEVSIFLLNFVFAGMFIGRKIPSFTKSLKSATPQILLGQILSWGQVLIPSVIVAFILNRYYDLHAAFSTLVAIGFDGGATVAVGYTSTFEELGWYPDGVQLGIAAGVVGVLGGCVIGVSLINYLVCNGYIEEVDDPEELPDHIRRGIYRESEFERAGTITIVPQSIEPLAMHFCFFGLAMLGGWGIVTALEQLPGYVGEFFGFAPLFPFAMISGLIFQMLVNKLGYGEYIDRGLAERLSGLGLEFCILSVFASLNLPLVLESSVPLGIIVVSGIVWSIWSAIYVAPRIMPNFWPERMLIDYGQSMGNVPVGMLLLRCVDPEFETPVLEAFSYKHAFHAPVFFSILAFLPIVAAEFGIGYVIGISAFAIFICFLLAFLLGYWHSPRINWSDEITE